MLRELLSHNFCIKYVKFCLKIKIVNCCLSMVFHVSVPPGNTPSEHIIFIIKKIIFFKKLQWNAIIRYIFDNIICNIVDSDCLLLQFDR